MRMPGTFVIALFLAAGLSAQAPVTHTFTPERFYNTFSFAHPAALRSSPASA